MRDFSLCVLLIIWAILPIALWIKERSAIEKIRSRRSNSKEDTND